MLFLSQLRSLKREVQSQLGSLADEEQARVRRDSRTPAETLVFFDRAQSRL